eukprot:scaffold193469_cov37-Tisochrysis_lutea.AAC.1
MSDCAAGGKGISLVPLPLHALHVSVGPCRLIQSVLKLKLSSNSVVRCIRRDVGLADRRGSAPHACACARSQQTQCHGVVGA